MSSAEGMSSRTLIRQPDRPAVFERNARRGKHGSIMPRGLLLFLDFDGTLAPIVAEPMLGPVARRIASVVDPAGEATRDDRDRDRQRPLAGRCQGPRGDTGLDLCRQPRSGNRGTRPHVRAS